MSATSSRGMGRWWVRALGCAWLALACAAWAGAAEEPSAPVASTATAASGQLGHVEGRVLLRAPGTRKLEPVLKGRVLAEGEVLLSGDQSRFEVLPGPGGEGVRWRVGRRAVFALQGEGARLLAGTGLVQIAKERTVRVESTRCAAVLPAGSWLVQAVDSQGLKIVCLDGELPVEARGAAAAKEDKAAASVTLKPGELVFLQPDGRSFSPAVTVYLEEVLATSRLVNGFPEELPGLRRLINLAIAQSERLTKLSPAVVAGARSAGAFQIAVPDAKPSSDAKSEKEK